MNSIGIEATLEVILRGPILVHSSAIGPWGVDAVALRDSAGHLIVPGDAVKGKIREAWDQIGGNPFPEHTRAVDMATFREGENAASREKSHVQNLEAFHPFPLFFSDFCSVAVWPPPGRQTVSQTALDADTGTAKPGSLRTYDCPVLPGQLARFRGAVRFLCSDEDAAKAILDRICAALAWVLSFGSQKSVGYGRNVGAQGLGDARVIEQTVTRFSAAAAGAQASAGVRSVLVDFSFRDPLCVPSGVVNGNIFESRDEIPGETLRGAVAELLKQIGGLPRDCQDLAQAGDDHPFAALCRHFSQQSLAGKPRPGEVPTPLLPHLLHDRYEAGPPGGAETGCYSGRILCRLTTRSPCVFGNEHRSVTLNDGNTTARIDNLSSNGLAAIAGTTLKGMLSTVAEMASGSAMRVLNNRVLSIRSSMKQSKSALGIVFGEKGNRRILPLTFPTFRFEKKQYVPTDGSDNAVWEAFRAARIGLGLPANLTPIYIQRCDANRAFCFHHGFPVVAIPAASYDEISWQGGQPAPKQTPQKIVNRHGVLRPYRHADDDCDFPRVEPLDPAKKQYCGIVRYLQDKRDPGHKSSDFALFIRIPEQWNANGKFAFERVDPSLLVPAEAACARFDAIVADRFSSAPGGKGKFSCTELVGQTPFQLPRKKGDSPGNPGLRQGDLVYFRPASATEVESVSVSGIWREGVRWMWNPETGEPDLLDSPERRPMNAQRTIVTLAEKLFGWVDDVSREREEAESLKSPLPAYKGRARISDALSDVALEDSSPQANDGAQLKNVAPQPGAPAAVRHYFPLKILASPKPPCPEFYLVDTAAPGSEKIRRDFIHSGDVQIQGTKYYLVHRQTWDQEAVAHWKTKFEGRELNQKCFVRPLKPKTNFWFHIDFENLTAEELELLCYCLHPGDSFVHRCGFAKPLGLGAVTLTPVAIAYVDRLARYRREPICLGRAKRFSQTIGSRTELAAIPPTIRDYAGWEAAAAEFRSTDDGPAAARPGGVADLARRFQAKIPDQHQILMLVGSPPDGDAEVDYPPGQGPEEKIYEWFVRNRQDAQGKEKKDDHEGEVNQVLTPLNSHMTRIPPLRR